MSSNISLYIHIPFCLKKCNYCAFYSIPDCGEDIKQSYTDALIKQINAFNTSKTISSIYFGGGTPPVLGTDRLLAVFEKLKSKFNLDTNCEITVEANPMSVTLKDLKAMRKAGFNRLSMGMQSSDDKELALLGRLYNKEQYLEAVKISIDAGFEKRSTDIIFAIPHQTKESLEKSILTAISSSTPHISIYSLSIEVGTPFYRIKDNLKLPDEDVEEEMYFLICDMMKKYGYKHYEISSFAHEEYESRHNLHYWDCGEYVGFGAAAHSYFGGKRFSNIADVNKYISLVDENFYSPTDFNNQPFISNEEKLEELIMLGLRTSKGIKADKKMILKSKRFIELGFVQINNGYLSLTESGYRISNTIIAELI
ncbi:MAG: hypothetical protein A2Y15_05680 [Clostridiales bacterium GWF2_36_10]|nr:MAG: hypothetical protein A2Y15_05680 [Clostridiales bacterium GWF2_36_10]